MKKGILLILAAVVTVSGCTSAVEDLKTANYNYQYTISLDTDTDEELTESVNILQNRIDYMPIEASVSEMEDSSSVAIKTVYNNRSIIEDTLKEYSYRQKIPFKVKGTRTLNLSRSLEITNEGDRVVINGSPYQIGEQLDVGNYTLEVNSTGPESSEILITVLEKDNLNLSTRETRVTDARQGYSGRVPIRLSREGADRFYQVLSNYEVGDNGNLQNINDELVLMQNHLNGELDDSYALPGSLKASERRDLSLSFMEQTRSELERKMGLYRVVVGSSDMPAELQIESISVLSENQN